MIFISYRHENDAHQQRVRQLADQLKAAGVAIVMDELYLERKSRWS